MPACRNTCLPLFGRRQLLELGGATLGLNLGGLLRAQVLADEATRTTPKPRVRSCILVFYYGGPSHLDTFDMKPDAANTVRGEFQPISTSVPGVHICEHLPRIARLMHKVAIIRSMTHQNRLHDSASIEALTGRPPQNGDREEFASIAQFYPCYGSALTYCRQANQSSVPHIALPYAFRNVIEVPCQGGGFLGSRFDPLQVNVNVANRTYAAGATQLPESLSHSRLDRRRNLLDSLSVSSVDNAQAAARLDRFYNKAYDILHADWLRRALDISQESEAARQRYGYDTPPQAIGEGPGGNNGAELAGERELRGQNLLLARRLVEAGVPFVNVYDFRQQGRNWDAHFKNFSQHKNYLLPVADQSLAALIEDLDERGLLDSTLVIAMGEFGRTPTINANGGRDHWPDCYSVLLAGGGIRGGTVYGASDRIGAYPDRDPVTPADLAATIYHAFGLNPRTEVHDHFDRPHRLSEGIPLLSLWG